VTIADTFPDDAHRANPLWACASSRKGILSCSYRPRQKSRRVVITVRAVHGPDQA
jgi:hypothetical protein